MKTDFAMPLLVLVLSITGCATSTAAEPELLRIQEARAALALPSLSFQLELLGYDTTTVSALSGASNLTFVHVTFSGPILHITEGSKKRAVVVHDANHRATMEFKPEVPSTITDAFNDARCDEDDCTISLNRLAVEVVDNVTGEEAVNALDVGKGQFRARVPRIGHFFTDEVPAESDLHPHVWLPIPPYVEKPAVQKVAAYFAINRGTFFSTRESACPGRFTTEVNAPYRDFAQSATATFAFKNRAKLRIGRQDQKGFETWLDVPLAGARPEVKVVNHDMTPGHESHFYLFNELKHPSLGKTVPDVEPGPNCKSSRDEVPGCGNSSWP